MADRGYSQNGVDPGKGRSIINQVSDPLLCSSLYPSDIMIVTSTWSHNQRKCIILCLRDHLERNSSCDFMLLRQCMKGKGYSPRDTESGQLLIDRALHLDVLEYLLWINRYNDVKLYH